MIWPFKKKKKRNIDNIGPDKAKIFVMGQVIKYTTEPSGTWMSVEFGANKYYMSFSVPTEMITRFPAGSTIKFQLENV